MHATTRRRILLIALIALPLLLALSYPWRDASAGIGQVLSAIGWFGFLLDLLLLLGLAVTTLTMSLLARRRAAG